MRTKHKSYLIKEGKQTVIQEETYDEKGQVIQAIDYRESPAIEKIFEYNSIGQLIFQSEFQGGVEKSSQLFEYNNDGEIVDEKLKIGGVLYEHTLLTKTDTGFVRTMTQDGVEIERLEIIIKENDWSNKFYCHDELLEIQVYNHHLRETKITSFELDMHIIIKEKYNSKDELVLKEEFHENGTLLASNEFEIQNGMITKESIRDFKEGEKFYERIFDYNKNNDLINFEIRTSTGSLQSFHKRKFDKQNRLLEESGYSNGYFSGISGIHQNYDHFHIVHEYEECPFENEDIK